MSAGRARRLVLADRPGACEDGILTLHEIRRELRGGRLLRRMGRYSGVDLVVEDLEHWRRPFLGLALARLLSRGDCTVRDQAGRGQPAGWAALGRAGGAMLRDALAARRVLREYEAALAALGGPAPPRRHDPHGATVVLRSGVGAAPGWGGAASHLRGVLQGLAALDRHPVLAAPEPLPELPDEVRVLKLAYPARFRDFPSLAPLAASEAGFAAARNALAGTRVGFVYHRNLAFDLAGARLARALGVPLVLEYNGSELWMARHWGGGLSRAPLVARAEGACLAAADVIAVVSTALADELAARGIDRAKIAIAPNGVDTRRFTPAVDGGAVRRRLGLDGLVIGFSGSFGRWHGADILAEAFALLAGGRTDAMLLMIGDGETRAAAERALAAAGLGARARFTGPIASADMPAHLAACDVLVSPQVPNPDGTPFFGSPTKLVEYMAMGKAVIASDLGQMAETVRDGATGLLVPPADATALAAALARLAADPGQRARLGAAARREAEGRGWAAHVATILARLDERCPCG